MPDYEKIHRQNIERYSRQIRQLYLDVINEVSKLSVGLSLNANNEFYFRSYSDVNKAVNELILELNKNVYATTVEGINLEWDLAVGKNNEIAQTIFGKKLAELPKEIRENYLSNNGDARRAFIQRKIDGLKLSDRVWRNTRALKQELELALEYGIGEGVSADTLSRQIRLYLNEPDRLYRRVRDKNGVLRLSKAARAYSPGRGIARSSYKNAVRLARNEINNSYRQSEHEKRQNADFIVGFEVRVSPGYDRSLDSGGIVCEDLQGKYPKDFNFQGFHTNCRCTSRAILKTDEELQKDTELMLNGDNPTATNISENYVSGMQDHFKKYVKENSNLWKNWSRKPYFLDYGK